MWDKKVIMKIRELKKLMYIVVLIIFIGYYFLWIYDICLKGFRIMCLLKYNI